MSTTDPLEQEIDSQEGERAAPYKDSRGLWTVGEGRCLETAPLTGAEWKYLLDNGLIDVNLEKAGADWLEGQIIDAITAKLAATFSWWPTITQARRDALIDMAYQMGVPKLLTFSQMLRAITYQDWPTVYEQALASDWAQQTPARAQQVAAQLRDGVYPPGIST